MTARLCFGAIVFSFVIKFDNDEGEYKIVGWHPNLVDRKSE
jgi:hypothetical protein